MAKFQKTRQEFVTREDTVFDVVMLSDENGNILGASDFGGTGSFTVTSGSIDATIVNALPIDVTGNLSISDGTIDANIINTSPIDVNIASGITMSGNVDATIVNTTPIDVNIASGITLSTNTNSTIVNTTPIETTIANALPLEVTGDLTISSGTIDANIINTSPIDISGDVNILSAPTLTTNATIVNTSPIDISGSVNATIVNTSPIETIIANALPVAIDGTVTVDSGTIDANITNTSPIPVSGDVNVTNASLDVNLLTAPTLTTNSTIVNTSPIDISGNVTVTSGSIDANITNASINTNATIQGTPTIQGSVDATIVNTSPIPVAIDTTVSSVETKPIRYSQDASGRNKVVIDKSLFYSTWRFRVPYRVWEESSYDVVLDTYTVKPIITDSISENHMLSVKSGTVANAGNVLRSKRHIRYKPNRSHLVSFACICPTAINLGSREWGITTPDNGIFFNLIGDGVTWDLEIGIKDSGAVTQSQSIKSLLPVGFNPENLNTYEIQFEFDECIFHFIVNKEVILTLDLEGTLPTLPFSDPALPISFESLTFDGTENILRVSSVDVTTEGGTEERLLPGAIDTDGLVSLGNSAQNCGVLALKVPRTITYNGSPVYNSRGAVINKVVGWCLDRAYISIYVGRDLALPNLNGPTVLWTDVPDSNLQYVIGGDPSALCSALDLDSVNMYRAVAEWQNVNDKNTVENITNDGEYYLTPGDILVVSMRALGNGKDCSTTLYFTEEL
jgi:hypothetical protein